MILLLSFTPERFRCRGPYPHHCADKAHDAESNRALCWRSKPPACFWLQPRVYGQSPADWLLSSERRGEGVFAGRWTWHHEVSSQYLGFLHLANVILGIRRDNFLARES
jgi:hypothetical protein